MEINKINMNQLTELFEKHVPASRLHKYEGERIHGTTSGRYIQHDMDMRWWGYVDAVKDLGLLDE